MRVRVVRAGVLAPGRDGKVGDVVEISDDDLPTLAHLVVPHEDPPEERSSSDEAEDKPAPRRRRPREKT